MGSCLVSIIMPTYNRAAIIKKSIMSVLKQTFQKFELIIVDDASSDSTYSLVQSINDSRVKYICLEENHGACYARNRGLEIAKGSYISFLDSDNIWNSKFLEERMKHLRSSGSRVGGVFGYMTLFRNRERLCTVPSLSIGTEIMKTHSNRRMIEHMLFDNIIDTNSIILRRKCAESVGGFDESLKRLQDWDFFFRIFVFSGYRIKFVDDYLVNNYLQTDSLTARGNEKNYWLGRKSFLTKYKDIFNQYNCFENAIYSLGSKINLEKGEEYYPLVLDILSKDEMKKLVMKSLDETLKVKEELKNERIGTEFWIELNKKNNQIIECQTKLHKLNVKSLKRLFAREGYKRIAIYGYGALGQMLYSILSSCEMEITCIIDKKRNYEIVDKISIIEPNQSIDADVVIVTAMQDFERIKNNYENGIPYVSILDIIEKAEKEKENE